MLHKIRCPSCNAESQQAHDILRKAKTIVCKECNFRFNIFTIYDSFYQDIPLAKEVVDFKKQLIFKDYRISGPEQEVRAIHSFFEANNFRKLFDDIVFECLKYGSSFLRKESQPKRITPVPLAKQEIVIEAKIDPPASAYHYFAKLIAINGNELERENYFHFSMHDTTEPFGDSVYGFWIHDWYAIMDLPSALVEASVVTKRTLDSSAEELFNKAKKALRQDVISAAGIHPGMIGPDTRNRRRELTSVVERELFPFILDRKWQYRDYPKFEISGHYDVSRSQSS